MSGDFGDTCLSSKIVASVIAVGVGVSVMSMSLNVSAESAGLIVVFVDVMSSMDSSISASDAVENISRVKFLATGPSVMLVIALVSFVMLVLFRVMISADMSDSVEVWFVFDKALSADRVTDFAPDNSADVAMDASFVVADVAVDVDDANDVVVVVLVVAGLVVFAVALPVNLLSIGS